MSSFNLFLIRSRGWGNPALIIKLMCQNSKGQNVSLIAFIETECLAYWDLFDGSRDKAKYLKSRVLFTFILLSDNYCLCIFYSKIDKIK